MGSVRTGGGRSRWAVGLVLALFAGLVLVTVGARASEVCNGITQVGDASNASLSPSSVTAPVVCTGDVGGSDTGDWFGLTITPQLAGQTIVVTMRQTISTAGQTPIFNLKLYDQNNNDRTAPQESLFGVPTPTDGRGCVGSGTFETIPNMCVWTGAEQGLWRVGVVPAPNSSSGTGSYVVAIATTVAVNVPLTSCEPAGDAGNSPPGRVLSPPPKALTCSGSVGLGADTQDYFSFTLNSPLNEIQVGVTSPTSGVDIDVEIIGPPGTTCSSSGGSSASCVGDDEGPDTVIARGPGCAGVPNCYSIRVFLHLGSPGGTYYMDIQEFNL